MGFREKRNQRRLDRENAEAYQKAHDNAEDGEIICGTLNHEGRPLYFAVPATATNEDVRRKAFEIRNGRPMSKTELLLAEYAARGMADEKIEEVWT